MTVYTLGYLVTRLVCPTRYSTVWTVIWPIIVYTYYTTLSQLQGAGVNKTSLHHKQWHGFYPL